MQKDEIKKILDKLKYCVNNPIDTEVDRFTEEAYDVPNYFCLDPTTNDCKVLYDCITNLQEELKSANESITWWQNRFNALQEENKRLNNIIDKLEKDIQKEIDRTNDLILEDGGLGEITTIRKMLNETRQCILFRIKELKGRDKE